MKNTKAVAYFFVMFGLFLTSGCALLKTPEILVRDNNGAFALSVAECGTNFSDLSKFLTYRVTEYVNEDGGGERVTMIVDPERKLGIGMTLDLIHKNGNIEPMVRILSLATSSEMTAYRKDGKWNCFSGTASWLSLTEKTAGSVHFSYEINLDTQAKILLSRFTMDRKVAGKVLVWNWQPPKNIHNGKKKHPDLEEIELARWEIH